MLHVPVHSKVRHRPEQVARCRRSQQAKAKGRTRECGGNGFLNHRFHPVMERQEELQDRSAVEQSFFASLHHLCNLYQFVTPDTSSFVYPYNILVAFRYAVRKMQQAKPDLKLVITQDETNVTTIATVKEYNTGTTLYYIPVYPLYRMVKQKHPGAKLLLSVYAYFLQVANVPYFLKDYSFLNGCYEVIREWILDDPGDWSKDELKEVIKELALQEKGGSMMLKQMNSPVHLNQFAQRLCKFTPENNADRQLKRIAESALELLTNYPGRSIFNNILPGFLNPDEEDRVQAEHYISFMWEDSGYRYDQLIEYVNSHIQEYGEIDEPLSIQFFNRPQVAEIHDLHFEESIFNLMDELVNFLNHVE